MTGILFDASKKLNVQSSDVNETKVETILVFPEHQSTDFPVIGWTYGKLCSAPESRKNSNSLGLTETKKIIQTKYLVQICFLYLPNSKKSKALQ